MPKKKAPSPFVDDFARALAAKMSSLPTLLHVLKAVQADEVLWRRLVAEIDSDEAAASDFLRAMILAAESTDEPIETMAGYEIVRVALHNAVGCAAFPNNSRRPDLAGAIPCTGMTFRIVRSEPPSLRYELVFAGEECCHARSEG